MLLIPDSGSALANTRGKEALAQDQPRCGLTSLPRLGLDVAQHPLDVLCFGEVQFQQLQLRRAALPEFLRPGAVQVQHAGVDGQAQLVQVASRRLPEPGVAAWEGSRRKAAGWPGRSGP